MRYTHFHNDICAYVWLQVNINCWGFSWNAWKLWLFRHIKYFDIFIENYRNWIVDLQSIPSIAQFCLNTKSAMNANLTIADLFIWYVYGVKSVMHIFENSEHFIRNLKEKMFNVLRNDEVISIASQHFEPHSVLPHFVLVFHFICSLFLIFESVWFMVVWVKKIYSLQRDLNKNDEAC